MLETVFQNPQDAEKESGQDREKVSLSFLFFTFLKIGSVAFGGFMSLISVIEDVIVKRRQLLEHRDILDGISLANLLPGPMAVNVVAFVGYRLRGGLGAVAAMTGVILPSFVLLLVLSYLYFNYSQVAGFNRVFQGFIPAVAAIVISVVWRLGRKTITGATEAGIAVAAIVVLIMVPDSYRIYAPLMLIAVAGLIGYKFFRDGSAVDTTEDIRNKISKQKLLIALAFFGSLVAIWFLPLPLDKNSLGFLTLTFASMSLMLFGGGYVFIPVIGSIVVLDYGWLTQQEFTDGIALGQVTPGPILISATFIGYKVAGFWGALCSTVAIFAVPAMLMVTVSQGLDFIRQSSAVQASMHGIHCAVIGMILVAAFVILKTAFPVWPVDLSAAWPAAFIFVAALIGLLKFNLDVIWIIPPAGVLGYFLF